MKFNIKYPPLVEQAYSYAVSMGLDVTKEEVYRHMVDSGMLNEDGSPTQKAITAGLIEAAGNDPIKEFKAANPIMANIPDEHFKLKNGKVLMDCYAVKAAAKTVLNDPTASQELKDNAQYLLDEVENLDHNEWH